MPYIKDKNLVNIYEEVDKANQTINKLNKLLKEEEENNSILRKHRIILGIFGLLALILFLWSFLPKSNKIDNKYLIKNNLSLINNDTLHDLKEAKKIAFEVKRNAQGIVGETIVYSIQIGAFANFKAKLFSDDLAHMKEFEEGGLNKYAIGNFVTYAEALVLKEDLKRLGFIDCFIIAQSYGDPVNIREALELSEETQYLK
ncbi:SPOR domain-containing protein [Aureibaculum sp. 2210JD6-5]|uniref:SPOR domain-containing protein n=1 Tax=Aureibaculum sp. 2210JD6-5 TaxID=3103957 RepID=UPI002AAD50A8|nr:SPOR domain-containing protein [Aureibaculum sp. 2210JD6-5]MDY7393779.1 SPOR domain-containing protein [Aureibaculum sp. 2210JD6-5]